MKTVCVFSDKVHDLTKERTKHGLHIKVTIRKQVHLFHYSVQHTNYEYAILDGQWFCAIERLKTL